MAQFSGSTQAAVDYNSTIIGPLELSEKKWVLAVQLPGVRTLRNDPLPALEVEVIPLERLRAPPRAIRTLDAAHVRDVAGSISALGFSVPVLVSRDYFVLDGTARVEAARLLGLERVPCIRIGHLSEDAANAANGREGSRPNDCAIALEA